MLKFDKITKHFGIFLVSYIVLLLLFQLKPVQQANNVFYCFVGEKFFNAVNPTYYADYISEAKPNDKGFNMTFKLFDRKIHGNKTRSKAYVKRAQHNREIAKNLYDLNVIPLILLISLYLATPGIKWKKKILLFLGSLFVVYLFLTFHISHIFENLDPNKEGMGTGLWHKFIKLFGFGGLTESMYLLTFVAYGIFAMRKSVSDYFINGSTSSEAPKKSISKKKKG